MNDFRNDPLAREFWLGCDAGELMIQRCEAEDCGRAQFYPGLLCRRCGSLELAWERASGYGTLYAVTRVDRPPIDDEGGGHCLALVQLDEGPRLLSHIVGGVGVIPPIATRLKVEFSTLPGQSGLFPVFAITP